MSAPTPVVDNSIIDFIEESIIKKGHVIYNIKLGIKENGLVIRVVSENSKDMFYYQQHYNLVELQNLSIIFSMYKTVKDIIIFLKKLKFDIEEKNEALSVRFNLYMPDGENKIIDFSLKKCLLDINYLIKYLLEENKSMKAYIKNLENTIKENNAKYNNQISNLTMENKKLWAAINTLNNKPKNQNINKHQIIPSDKIKNKLICDSKITSINSINFILDYLRINDKALNYNNIKLLYRGSRDGDRTKTCHQLCDNQQNVLIIMQSDDGYIFGGFSKIGFKTINDESKYEYKIDNNAFLFSIDLKKIYPVFKDKYVISHILDTHGLCFNRSLAFRDHFMNKKDNNFYPEIKTIFNGVDSEFEMNGQKPYFKCRELEVFQFI